MIDEKIAELEKAKRMEKRENNNEEQTEEKKEPSLTVEEIEQEIEKGSIVIQGMEYRFEPKMYVDGFVSWLNLVGRMKEENNVTEDGDRIALLTGEEDNFDIYIIYVHQKAKKTSIQDHTESSKKAFKELGLFMGVEDIYEGEHISYFTYYVPTGKGDIYGINYWQTDGEYKCVGSASCRYQDKDTVGRLIQAMLRKLTVVMK